MNFLLGKRKRRYTVDRLRSLYTDLLHLIEASNDDLKKRSLDDLQNTDDSHQHSLKAYTDLLLKPLWLVRNDGSGDSPPPTRDLAAAFRLLSATPSPDKEGDNGGAVAVRDDAAVSALAMARAFESRVVELIRSIGEVVVYGEQTAGKNNRDAIRSDPVFEYFCEKSLISLLVDIAKAKPSSNHSEESSSVSPGFHGVVWSPLVKAQVLQTVSILVANVQDPTSLYYLLSNNYVNELVMCMLPMRQWTDPALEELMPVFVSFLKNLALQLARSPDLFSFLKRDDDASASFPLFSAALEVATSSFAQSDSFVHVTCINLLVNVLQISNPSVRSWVSAAATEQRLLAAHLCQRLVDRYQRLGHLTAGPVVDPVRSSAVLGQFTKLHDQLEFINDVLWCGVRTLNVRLCEFLLQRVVFVLLQNLIPQNGGRRLVVGMLDDDVIPESQALAQTSALFLSHLFLTLEYAPFLRMLAVAILHPDSPSEWKNSISQSTSTSEEYILTPALSAIVQKKSSTEDGEQQVNSDSDVVVVVANPFRKELLELLRGEEGDWRFITAAMLLESVLKSDALDLDTLKSLDVIPRFSDDEQYDEVYPPSPWEDALEAFLARQHERSCSVSALALECAGSLALAMLSRVVESATKGGKDFTRFDEIFHASPLVRGLKTTHAHFCTNAQRLQGAAGVSELFVDLIELAITTRYTMKSDHHDRMSHGKRTYVCSLPKFACTAQSRNPEVLVRKFRDVSSNDVEDARFAIRMALHFRAICNTVEKLHGELSSAIGPSSATPRWAGEAKFQFDTTDVADDLLLSLGGLKEKPAIGTDLDLRGRTTFRFFPASNNRSEPNKPNRALGDTGNQRKRKYSEDMLRPTTELVLVVDPTDIFVVKPATKGDENRGTILCSASLSSVIAFAPDGVWLHVAIRHMEDIGYLIKNGNMALRFCSVGTCLIVRQFLERSRSVLQRDLMGRIRVLFGEGSDLPEENDAAIPHASEDEECIEFVDGSSPAE